MNKLTLTGTSKIKIPKEMVYVNKKGKESIVKTLTKTGAITKKDKKPVVEIVAEDGSFEVVSKGKINSNLSKYIDHTDKQLSFIDNMFDGGILPQHTPKKAKEQIKTANNETRTQKINDIAKLMSDGFAYSKNVKNETKLMIEDARVKKLKSDAKRQSTLLINEIRSNDAKKKSLKIAKLMSDGFEVSKRNKIFLEYTKKLNSIDLNKIDSNDTQYVRDMRKITAPEKLTITQLGSKIKLLNIIIEDGKKIN